MEVGYHKISIFGIILFFYYASAAANVQDDEVSQKCPGLYCGRVVMDNGNLSECGACPRGFRPGEDSLCIKCDGSPTFYDWLYLGFMALVSMALHWFSIDFTNKRKVPKLIILHVSAFVESVAAAVLTLLAVEPLGYLQVNSCPVQHLSDWYSMLYNPSPDYVHTVHCTQEIVYPLYTIVMIYYAFSLVLMMLIRPLLSTQFVNKKGSKSIYAALYFFPILTVVQAICGGLLYYAFPYIILVISVATVAVHFSFFEEQELKSLLCQNFTNPRNIVILVGHWVLHAFGIISITELKNPAFHVPLLALVPFPTLFYLLTVKFTHPYRLEQV